MSFNIESFTSKIDGNGGPFRANRFFVNLSVPAALSELYDSSINFMIETASITGRTLTTYDDKKYGPIRKIARETLYQDLNLSFILTNSMKEKTLFDAWFEHINPSNTFNVRYYDSYVADLEVAAFDYTNGGAQRNGMPSFDNAVYRIKYEEAYPVNMDSIALNWGDNNNVAKMNIQFAYKKWSRIQ